MNNLPEYKLYLLIPKHNFVQSSKEQKYISINHQEYLIKRIVYQYNDNYQIYFDYNTDGTQISFHKSKPIDETLAKPISINDLSKELKEFLTDPLLDIEIEKYIANLENIS